MDNINSYFEKIFVITLENSFRHKHLKEKFDFDYEIFFGVDGRNTPKHKTWSHGQLGCTISHLNLYKKIVDENIKNCLILEDDAIIIPNKLEHLKTLPNDWELLYLGWDCYSVRNPLNNSWIRIDKNNFNIIERTHAIAMTNSFAKELYDFNYDCKYTADGALTEIIKQKSKFCYLSSPKIFDFERTKSITEEVDRYMQGKTDTIFHDIN